MEDGEFEDVVPDDDRLECLFPIIVGGGGGGGDRLFGPRGKRSHPVGDFRHFDSVVGYLESLLPSLTESVENVD